MIEVLKAKAHDEEPICNCKRCKGKGLLDIWRYPDFHRALQSNSEIGTYQINGPQWVFPFGTDRPEDHKLYSAIALCDCEAGEIMKMKHPNLKVYHEPEPDDLPF